MMSGRVLDNEPLVALNAFEDVRLFDGPGSNVGPVLVGLRVLLFGMRRRPSRVPIVCELLKERRFKSGGLS